MFPQPLAAEAETKDSIIAHSKEFPHLIDASKNFDKICEVRNRKGFHKKPSYEDDLKKVARELLSVNVIVEVRGRNLHCRDLVSSRNPFQSCYRGFSTMIHRHKPSLPFRRLRNKRM